MLARSAEARAPRSGPLALLPGLALVLALVGCELFEDPAPEHPGCPGQSFRSATSENACTCGEKNVMQAGALECKTCNPVPSNGAFCSCPDGSLISFDGSLNQSLGLKSAQVSCGEPSACPEGEKREADGCVACEPLECGSTCGPCQVGESCVSGKCVAASKCVVQGAVKFSRDQNGNVFQELAPSCSVREGEIVAIAPSTQLVPGGACDFQDEAGCQVEGSISLLTRPDAQNKGCPGESRRAEGSSVCECPEGQLLTAGSLQCGDCDPSVSGGVYCDCGENAVLSFSGLLELDLGLASPVVTCEAPSSCEDGMRQDPETGECVECQPTDCGAGCDLCSVGETCVSGQCVAATACRIETVASTGQFPCQHRVGEIAFLGTSAELPIGQSCSFQDNGDLGACSYAGTIEVLSK